MIRRRLNLHPNSTTLTDVTDAGPLRVNIEP